ncbi:MAG: hypothetical protein Ct9H90mP16_21430 [Candidatus Poseidoniales archaeon]|nr:MAG: hypothetical protein Ct9H90mP16_21430 [Candidatus Poseidoniales archaeon]
MVISERTTPPFAPLRFRNHFFTVECDVDPVLNVGERPEFDDYRWATPRQLLDEWEMNQIRLPPPLVMILRELLEDTTVRSIERMANSPPRKMRGSNSHPESNVCHCPPIHCHPQPTRIATFLGNLEVTVSSLTPQRNV